MSTFKTIEGKQRESMYNVELVIHEQIPKTTSNTGTVCIQYKCPNGEEAEVLVTHIDACESFASTPKYANEESTYSCICECVIYSVFV